MAYNIRNNKEELYGVVQTKKHEQLKIVRISDENDEIQAVDIRTWFNTEDDPEYRVTKKGIRVKYEQLAETLKYILDAVGADVICDLSANYGIEIETENES